MDNTLRVRFKTGYHTVLFFVVASLVAACTSPVEPPELSDQQGSKVVIAHPRTVSADSSAHPVVIQIDETTLRHTTLGTPEIYPTNGNLIPIGTPDVKPVGEPLITRPGTDTFSLPEIVPAKGKKVIAKQPKPASSLPLRMKDGASCNLQYLDVDQGMNSSYIWDIFEDAKGNFWFATDGGGVTKYDGRTFLHFTEEQGLGSNYVRQIIQDKKGNLWFATISGITMYDGTSFTNYGKESGLKQTSVWSIIEDHNGLIWIGTYGGGIASFDGTNFTTYTTQQGLPNNMVWFVFEDMQGNIWAGTNGGGICKFDDTKFYTYTTANGLADNVAVSVVQDAYGSIWFGTNNGISHFEGNSFTNYTSANGLSNPIVRSLFLDSDKQIWVGTYGGGVYKLGKNQLIRYSDTEGLSDGHVVSMEEDETGNIWFATYGGGVCKLNDHSFRHYTDKQGLNNYFIWSMCEDDAGNIWMGTNGGGVARYDGKAFRFLNTKTGLSSDVVRAVYCDKAGAIWLGTYGSGVMRIAGNVVTFLEEKDGLCNNNVLDIQQDKEGRIWIATDGGGLSIYDGKTFTNYSIDQGLCSNYVRAMLQDKQGNVWLATHAGLCSINLTKQEIVRYNENESFRLRTLWCGAEDVYGNLWFGTGGYGAVKFNGSEFWYYTQDEGLSNNSVWSMKTDRDGFLWMGTEKGLNRVTSGEKGEVLIEQFHREDGLKAEDFYLKSALLDSSNHLWWGTGKALSVLDMDEFVMNSSPPKIQLTDIFQREEFIDYCLLRDSVDKFDDEPELKKVVFGEVNPFTNLPSDLELPFFQNHLTFYFSATDWSAPHAIRYEYQLVGLDPDWSVPTAENKADYRNIPYGHYTFKVRATGSSGKRSETVEYPFIIHPPWWHTWWARTIGVLILLTLIYSYIRWRERSLQARQKELKHKVEEATSEINQQKNLIEEKHKAITDSINYAERIQRSFLATKELLDENLKEYFVLYLPKDVVSGDFYWASKLNDGNFALVTADSTGHGVPGAIMSLLNITSLEKAVEHETDPAKILNHTRLNIIDRLSRDGTKDGGWDGMDCSFISFNFASLKMTVSAANNPVWIVRDGVLHEIKPDRFPVGKHEFDEESFTNHEFELKKGDMIYTMTDGYADQFGGPLGKKFKWKQLQKVLLGNAAQPMTEQKEKIGEVLRNWKSNLEQIDDICLIGIRV